MRLTSPVALLAAAVVVVLCYVLGGKFRSLWSQDVMRALMLTLGVLICLFVWYLGARIPAHSLELSGDRHRVYRWPAIAWGTRLGEIMSYDNQVGVLTLGGGRVELIVEWGGDPQQVAAWYYSFRQRLSEDPDLSLMGCLVEKVVVQTANITIPDLSDKAQRKAYEQTVITACQSLEPFVRVSLDYPLL